MSFKTTGHFSAICGTFPPPSALRVRGDRRQNSEMPWLEGRLAKGELFSTNRALASIGGHHQPRLKAQPPRMSKVEGTITPRQRDVDQSLDICGC
jgi:hypothetical protein